MTPTVPPGGSRAGVDSVAPAVSAKSIVLTGGAGNVGRVLRKALAGRIGAVRILDIADPGPLAEHESWTAVDITDLAALTAAVEGADAIVHFAGYPNERAVEDILRVNVLGTHNVYEAARRTGIGRIVLASSNHVTGFYPRDARVGVEDQMRPDGLYGLSKCWGELEAGVYFEKTGIRTLAIRIGNAGERPVDARGLAVWISPRDLAQLVLIGLEHPGIDCTTVYGVSATDAAWWDNSVATALGYRPQDRTADFAAPEAFQHKPSALPQVADHFQGGWFSAQGHDGVVRRRRFWRAKA
ncbi:NAD-dependent epimerase/dehydratase family protein [Inquilinus limosus]|uniref:NAD-dependent epimerase/dehydratase family protein n=1 Tax=Inquilinus limosus TaxID=171674 RepID=UPI0009DB8815|nr:NAD(P)-dependent oxidoreductase [Inquilinus limosus]